MGLPRPDKAQPQRADRPGDGSGHVEVAGRAERRAGRVVSSDRPRSRILCRKRLGFLCRPTTTVKPSTQLLASPVNVPPRPSMTEPASMVVAEVAPVVPRPAGLHVTSSVQLARVHTRTWYRSWRSITPSPRAVGIPDQSGELVTLVPWSPRLDPVSDQWKRASSTPRRCPARHRCRPWCTSRLAPRDSR